MNLKEFDSWWTDFKLRFPDLGGPWFCKGRSDSQQRVILNGFAGVLSDVGLTEAVAVNKAMERGDLEGFRGEWDRDEIARRVRKHALDQRAPEPGWNGPDEDPALLPRAVNHERHDVELRGAFRELLRMQRNGATKEECAEFLRSKFPERPIYDQPRYACAMCFDRGRIEVWHPELVIRLRNGDAEAIDTCMYRTSAVACSCKTGAIFTGRKIPLVQYDPSKHCRVRNSDTTSDTAAKDLREWIADLSNVTKHKNYEPCFAEFGQ